MSFFVIQFPGRDDGNSDDFEAGILMPQYWMRTEEQESTGSETPNMAMVNGLRKGRKSLLDNPPMPNALLKETAEQLMYANGETQVKWELDRFLTTWRICLVERREGY